LLPDPEQHETLYGLSKRPGEKKPVHIISLIWPATGMACIDELLNRAAQR
jgi:hypothetical protein